MRRLIDANALITALLKNAIDYAVVFGDSEMHRLLVQIIAKQQPIDAIPISFIEEQAKLCNEIGFRRSEECYMTLIEKWREKNGTETD